jgi:ferredoxin-fold anticodon binding domain-containing protein
MPSASTIYNPEDVLKKEARGIGDFYLGVVKDVSNDYVITEKGLIDKNKFYIPKSRIIHIDAQVVLF